MPINGVLDMQRRSVQIGEIRMGYSVEVPGKDYRRPMRSDTWRFTTASEQAARAALAAYEGSTMAPWERRKGRWMVVTNRTALDVWVPPRGGAVDANMELWDGPRCLRRCDGMSMSFPSSRPCMCPQPDDPGNPDSVLAARDERIRLASLRPPQACKPLTRINVTIPDLPGLLGVWRLNTGSVNAAVETADSGEAMEIARAGGKYLPAVLRIEWRIRSADGKPYPVPVLQIGLSMKDLAQGALPAGPGGLIAQLRGESSGEQPKAITAGTPDLPGPAETHGDTVRAGEPDSEPVLDAQQIADIAANMAEARQDIEALVENAKALRCLEDHVCTDPQGQVYEELGEFLRQRWKDLPARQEAG